MFRLTKKLDSVGHRCFAAARSNFNQANARFMFRYPIIGPCIPSALLTARLSFSCQVRMRIVFEAVRTGMKSPTEGRPWATIVGGGVETRSRGSRGPEHSFQKFQSSCLDHVNGAGDLLVS